ncbi:hypothetical protein P7C73_g347, partial [Tremellales sp. Uapishka_1]
MFHSRDGSSPSSSQSSLEQSYLQQSNPFDYQAAFNPSSYYNSTHGFHVGLAGLPSYVMPAATIGLLPPNPYRQQVGCASPVDVFGTLPATSLDGSAPNSGAHTSRNSSFDSFTALKEHLTYREQSHEYPPYGQSNSDSVQDGSSSPSSRTAFVSLPFEGDGDMYENESSPVVTGDGRKRSRTAQACEKCRVRKARCFGGNPCNRCVKRHFTCEFSTAIRQRGPNKNKPEPKPKARRHSTSRRIKTLPVVPARPQGLGLELTPPAEDGTDTRVPTWSQSLPTLTYNHFPSSYPTQLPVGRQGYNPLDNTASSMYSPMVSNDSPSDIFPFSPEPSNLSLQAQPQYDGLLPPVSEYPFTPVSPAFPFDNRPNSHCIDMQQPSDHSTQFGYNQQMGSQITNSNVWYGTSL